MRKVHNTTQLLADLLTAQAAGKAVKIRYVKIHTGEVSRRSIEIHKIWVDKKGDICIRAWDRRDQEMTTFRFDHITHYTLHRSAKLADYMAPVAGVEAPIEMDTEFDDFIGFASWELRDAA